MPCLSCNNRKKAEDSRKALIAFLDEAVTAYGADPKQVYLMGFSQGGIIVGKPA